MKYPYRSYDDMSKLISKHIDCIPSDVSLVVGIPRSGMIPAYMIGLLLNKRVCSLDEFVNNIQSSHGERELSVGKERGGAVLFVDDSIHSGVQLTKTKERLKGYCNNLKTYFLAIYARSESAKYVDMYFEIVETPRVFQWNYLYQGVVEKSCFDLDGVLCKDPTSDQNDDGENYLDFLQNAEPLFIPNQKIHSIVTSRLEKYRNLTEEWLKKNGIKYDRLIMLDLPSKAERIKQKAHAAFKADYYKNDNDALFFYESERKQAIEIANITGKPVFCTSTGELFDGGLSDFIEDGEQLIDSSITGKRILLYTQELTYTGSPFSLLRIARVLKNAGAYVEVWSKEEGEFRKEFKNEGIRIIIHSDPFLYTGQFAKDVSSFDLAIANTVLSHKFYLNAKSIIPTIWYIREASNLPDICRNNYERENALKTADKLYSVSEYAADFIRSHYNNSVEVLHNCVEDYYSEGDRNVVADKINVLALGTINYRKAFDVYIDSILQMPDNIRNKFHFYFAGRLLPELEDFWKPLLEKIKGIDEISFLGEITSVEDKIELMKKMNIICIMSRDESCSLVALEGAMLGKALVVTQNVGAKYLVDDNDGWIVETGSADALAEVWLQASENKQLLEEMGINSRQKYLLYASMEIYEQNILNMALDNLKIKIDRRLKQSIIAKRTSEQLDRTLDKIHAIEIENDIKFREMYKNNQYLQYRISEIEKSFSYRIGRFITWGWRHLRHLITGKPV